MVHLCTVPRLCSTGCGFKTKFTASVEVEVSVAHSSIPHTMFASTKPYTAYVGHLPHPPTIRGAFLFRLLFLHFNLQCTRAGLRQPFWWTRTTFFKAHAVSFYLLWSWNQSRQLIPTISPQPRPSPPQRLGEGFEPPIRTASARSSRRL